MHKSIVKVGLFLGAIILLSGTQKVEALTVNELLATNSSSIIAATSEETTNLEKEEKIEEQKEEQKQKDENENKTAVLGVSVEPKVHVVESGQSLSKIANQYQTKWKRLYDKNTHINNPDLINIGDQITIPDHDESLLPRELPVVAPVSTPAVTPRPVKKPTPSATGNAVSKPTESSPVKPRGSSSGNLYSFGNCTWYVKNRRPDLPNNLGNADTWVSRARAQGLPTGSAPRVGAVGQKGMHVVYVESVNSDGTVTISEMNREGFNIKSSRTVPASFFQYIY